MPSLVLEGGSFRGIFSAGVMDGLLENDCLFDLVIGVSAGIANGVSYCSLQNGRNMNILRQYRNDRRYYGPTNFITDRSIFGVKFVFGEVPDKLIPFDREALKRYPGKIIAVATNAWTGEATYLDVKKHIDNYDCLVATCSIPGFFPPRYIEGVPYFDGGVSDSIPILQAFQEGQEKHLIVLTQPQGFQKTTDRKVKFLAKSMERKYPAIAKDLLNRAAIYNATVEMCHKLETLGAAVVLQPEHAIQSTESDVSTLEKTYFEGKQMVYNQIEAIRALYK